MAKLSFEECIKSMVGYDLKTMSCNFTMAMVFMQISLFKKLHLRNCVQNIAYYKEEKSQIFLLIKKSVEQTDIANGM